MATKLSLKRLQRPTATKRNETKILTNWLLQEELRGLLLSYESSSFMERVNLYALPPATHCDHANLCYCIQLQLLRIQQTAILGIASGKRTDTLRSYIRSGFNMHMSAHCVCGVWISSFIKFGLVSLSPRSVLGHSIDWFHAGCATLHMHQLRTRMA